MTDCPLDFEERGYGRLVLSPSAGAVRFYQRAGFLVPGESGGDRLLVRPAVGSTP